MPAALKQQGELGIPKKSEVLPDNEHDNRTTRNYSNWQNTLQSMACGCDGHGQDSTQHMRAVHII